MIVVLWILCAVAGGVIDYAKGNSVFGGILVGFLLGPIGVIIAACWPSNKPVVVEVAQPSLEGPVKVCPACISEIPAEASKCRYCSSNVADIDGPDNEFR